MSKPTLLYFLFCLLINRGQAQTGPNKIDTLLTGNWKGSSLCQVKNSPCHDETVVYHISKHAGVDSFFIDARKIVNGAEEEMGILAFAYDKKRNQLFSTAYKGIWTFTVETNKLEGTLFVQGDLYRKILVYKQR